MGCKSCMAKMYSMDEYGQVCNIVSKRGRKKKSDRKKSGLFQGLNLPMPGLKEREGGKKWRKKKVALHKIEPRSTDTNGYRSMIRLE